MEEGGGVEEWSVSAPWAFRDTEYTVSADVRSETLMVQVEEKLTAEQWKGQFEAKRWCNVKWWKSMVGTN